MTQEELKLVLEALKWCHGGEPCGTAEAIAVVEKALANVATNDTSKEYVDEMQKQRHEQEPVALPCCGYTNPEAIKWNTHNQVVQCHNCGQVYTPQRQPLTQEQRDAIVRPAVPNDWNDYEVIDAVEAAHGIKE